MKGIVFTELLELVEEKFGLQMVDEIITASNLESNGVYTAVGTYSFAEMISLLTNLSERTQLSIDDLLLVYSQHFFKVLKDSYPGLLLSYTNPLDLLASIESHIHVEVRKIYPDAELPTFIVIEQKEKSLRMIYKSSRKMASFGLGLMQETFKHFDKGCEITMDKIKDDGSEVLFSITQK
ncbi:MAG: hypothetical protein CL868_03015 [Cytophagaceae bacterium]|nr:hypothetical protein [Cytophagaceae bacterium]|tara:strand:- start:1141 stop:1680 length:540 start_codon:yes stop_codon:yes gene_type:complete